MANEEHLNILEQGVEVWNEWRKKDRLIQSDLRGAGLREANLAGADLTRTNLDRADLVGASLRGADLAGASLTGADLPGANLTGASLTGANLSWANLSWADLTEANLYKADLTEANLTEANLTEANLYKANLYKAVISSTIFADVDVSVVEGLETVRHRGPSYLDIHTLYKSHGKIPEVFLRGCGVPEDFITYLPSLTGKAIEFYSCFISYSHDDKAFARRVHDTLQGRGIRCWLDEKQVNPGDKIFREIGRGIRLWDKVVLCASRHSMTSWWVNHELEVLFEKERQLLEERGEEVLALVPLDLDGYLFSDDCTSDKKEQIGSRLAADFKGWESNNALFEEQMERVIKALRTDSGKEPPPKRKL